MASSNTSVARSNPSASQYPFPSHVNAASFVSIKLKNKTNYGLWLEQIKCLVECHGMLGFINGELICPDEDSEEWKRYDTLVKGWIFGSLSEGAMGTVVGLQTANDVWEKLKTSYGTPASLTSTTITEQDTEEYLPLCEAIMTNNWEKAKEIFNQDQGAVTATISVLGKTALHLAIHRVENIQFLENFLKEIEPDILPTLVSEYGKGNPLHQAAHCDNKIAAEMLVKKNPHLLFLLDDFHQLPIQGALLGYHTTTFRYLLEACENHIELSREDGYHSPFQGIHGAHILAYAISQGFLDVSYELIRKYPHLARTKMDHNHFYPLRSIAGQWDIYYSGTRYSYFQNFVYSCLPIDVNFSCDKHNIQDIENQQTGNAKLTTKCIKSCVYSGIRRIYVKFWKVAIIYVPRIKHLNGEKVKHREALLVLKCMCKEVGKLTKERDMRDLYCNALRFAVYNDTVEVVEEIIKYYPAALLISINGYTVTQFAITNRCEKTYSFLLNSLFYDKYVNQRILADGNNLIHLAAQLAPKHKLDLVNGAALQMQREVQWFEEVKNFVKPIYKELKNHKGETPIMMFRREHVQLRKEGEEWMKKTADSYTITAALIITIVFAAAITVPGGNDSNSGKAIFASTLSFIIFGVSDAISLFTSTTSLLLFLSILTTRFRDEDFLYRLPKRLILGLAMLFLSVTSMMVAFSATLYLTFGQGEAWILIPIATLACLPIASFVTLQLPLLADMISSTYGRGIFAKKSGHKEKLP